MPWCAAVRCAIASASQPPRLIISDHRLSNDENGLELIDRVRAIVDCEPPAILMTSDTEPQRILEADGTNCRVLHKPTRANVLLPLLQELRH